MAMNEFKNIQMPLLQNITSLLVPGIDNLQLYDQSNRDGFLFSSNTVNHGKPHDRKVGHVCVV